MTDRTPPRAVFHLHLQRPAPTYSPTSAESCSRDPIGFIDGNNLYKSYFAIRFFDPSGMKKCPGENWIYGKGASCDVQQFMDWLAKEVAELQTWLPKLKPCPCSLTCFETRLCGLWATGKRTTIKPCEKNPPGFVQMLIPNFDGSHTGTVYEVRQECSGNCEPGSQCTYGADGNLLTNPPGAGSADRFSGSCGTLGNKHHLNGDAQAYYCAKALDKKFGGSFEPFKKYYAMVRPTNSGKKCDPKPISDIIYACSQGCIKNYLDR